MNINTAKNIIYAFVTDACSRSELRSDLRSHAGIVKIGCSENGILSRLKGYSGCNTPASLLYIQEVLSPRESEEQFIKKVNDNNNFKRKYGKEWFTTEYAQDELDRFFLTEMMRNFPAKKRCCYK